MWRKREMWRERDVEREMWRERCGERCGEREEERETMCLRLQGAVRRRELDMSTHECLICLSGFKSTDAWRKCHACQEPFHEQVCHDA